MPNHTLDSALEQLDHHPQNGPMRKFYQMVALNRLGVAVEDMRHLGCIELDEMLSTRLMKG